MDATLLTSDAFWSDAAPVMMAAEGASGPAAGELPGDVYFQTSGSTGSPKWVALSRQALQVSAKEVNAHLEVGSGSCWGLLLPLHHVGGFGVAARAWQAGCRLEVGDARWEPVDAARWLSERRVTHTSMVPTQVHDLVKVGVRAPSSLQAVVVGGGQLSQPLGRQARDLGWPVLASFGMTEAASQIATQGIEALGQAYQPAPIPVLAHWQVRVGDDRRLSIAGEALFSGVLERQGGRWVHQPRDGDWHATSDRVAIDGRMLTPLGRCDLQVKVLGELVDLPAIERRLVELSAGALPADFLVVVALPDARAGHRLVPVVDAAVGRPLAIALLEKYAGQAPGYARLDPPVLLDPLPRTELGKPRRGECLQQLADRA